MTNRTTEWKATASVVAIGVALAAGGASAAEPAQGVALDEVVVTAQKRSERLQEVPLSIAAVSAQKLENAGAANLESIQRIAPGVNISNNAGSTTTWIYIRGGGTNLLDPSADPSVGLFVDEVYIPGTAGLQFDLLDLERVEVLKGPQGTLFGRNTSAGAISIVTKRPQAQQEGRLNLEAGDHGLRLARGSLTGPMSADGAWRYRVSGVARHRDPVTRNLIGRDPGEINSWGARGQVQYVGDDLDVLFSSSYFRSRNGQPEFVLSTAFTGGYIDDNAGNGPPTPNGFRHIRIDYDDGYEHSWNWDGVLRVEWQTGLGTLTSITAYREGRFDSKDDRDGSDQDAAIARVRDNEKSFSQELRLANSYDRWNWLAGLYYYHQDTRFIFQWDFGPDIIVYPPTPSTNPITDNHKIDVDAYAAFGQVSVNVSRDLKLNLGARYSEDRKSDERFVDWSPFPPVFCQVLKICAYASAKADKWSSFDPAASLQYQPVPDVMVYGSVRRGYKSGGYQTTFPLTRAAAEATYAPEKVTSYELGARTEFFDRRLLFNPTIFWVDTKDQQVNVLCGFALCVNSAGRSRTKGVDFQLTARPLEGLTIDWNGTLQRARYTDYRPSPTEDLSGNRLARSPTFSTNLSVDYVVPVRDGRVTLHGDVFHSSKVLFGDQNFDSQKGIYQPSYQVLNARIAYAPNAHWEVALWGRNITNAHYVKNIVTLNPAPGTGLMTPGDPSAFGVSLDARF